VRTNAIWAEMNFFFDRQPLTSLDQAVEQYKEEEFASPTRSTVPLLSFLKHGGAIWKSMLRHLGVPDCSVEAHLEFTVPPPRGRGTASHTDVMLIAGDHAVAIETKWTEPRYDEVGVWLNKGDTVQNRYDEPKGDPNRRAVLAGWVSLLQPRVNRKLDVDDFHSAVYQMVHRAASACSAGKLPTLMYLQFRPLPDGSPAESCMMDDLRYLHSLLGSPPNVPFWLAKVEARPNPAFEQIRTLSRGLPQTAQRVRDALRGEPLFTFNNISFQPVKGADCQ